MLHFDKYGPYVVASYVVAGVIIIGMVVLSILRLNAAHRKLAQLEKDVAK